MQLCECLECGGIGYKPGKSVRDGGLFVSWPSPSGDGRGSRIDTFPRLPHKSTICREVRPVKLERVSMHNEHDEVVGRY